MPLFFEEVTSRCGDTVFTSTIRPATDEEVDKARQLHEQGKCPHNIVIDEPGWAYSFRTCVTCGQCLGLI